MSLEVREVKSRGDLRKFIFLPEKIHKGHAEWVPPIYVDEWNYFNPKKNRAFSYCDTVLLLAYRDGKVVGRNMGIINRRFNESHGEKTGRFSYLECRDDQETAHALMQFVERWAREKGMNRMIGPYAFSDQDPEGFIIEGQEHLATIACNYNYDYMNRLIINEGYIKDVDYVVYKVDVPEEIPEFYQKIFQRCTRSGEFQIMEFKKRKELKPYIHSLFDLMNECYSHLYGFVPLDEKEMDELSKRYLPLLDPRFVKMVKQGDRVVAFAVGIPNMIPGIRKARGRLLPFGIFHILKSGKKTRQLDLLLGAIKENLRGKGLDVMMGMKILESAQKAGMTVLDSHHEMETNLKMRAENEKMGGKVIKRYRVYQKSLK